MAEPKEYTKTEVTTETEQGADGSRRGEYRKETTVKTERTVEQKKDPVVIVEKERDPVIIIQEK